MSGLVRSCDLHGNEYEVPAEELVWRPAVYGIVVRGDKILLTNQFRSLHLPGGGVELHETPQEAVVREVFEETGFRVANPVYADMVWTNFSYASTSAKCIKHVRSILFYYKCGFAGGRASTDGFTESEASTGGMPRWVSLKDLDSIESGSTVDWVGIVKRCLVVNNF